MPSMGMAMNKFGNLAIIIKEIIAIDMQVAFSKASQATSPMLG